MEGRLTHHAAAHVVGGHLLLDVVFSGCGLSRFHFRHYRMAVWLRVPRVTGVEVDWSPNNVKIAFNRLYGPILESNRHVTLG